MRQNQEKIQLVGDHDIPCRVSRLVREAVWAAIGDAAIRVELDVPERIEFPVDPVLFSRLVQSLTRAAAEALQNKPNSGGEICITAWQAGETLEIEVADNGPPLDDRPRYLPLTAAQLGADLLWQACPQGGSAVTAIISRSAAKRSAA
jgi:signal transduction histidine kinase